MAFKNFKIYFRTYKSPKIRELSCYLLKWRISSKGGTKNSKKPEPTLGVPRDLALKVIIPAQLNTQSLKLIWLWIKQI